MNKFEKQLEKWNHGILRGAQARLAKILQVSTATVALWATGKRHPSKGYMEKMGQLFGLDSYETSRLFLVAAPYPLTARQPSPNVLQDTDDTNTYSTYNFYPPLSAASNSISLPVFSTFPASFPSYREQDVEEWWTLPRHVAKGAKFLLQDPAGQTLFCIVPCTTWVLQHLVVAQTGENKYIFCRAKRQHGKIMIYQDIRGKTKLIEKGDLLRPLGYAVLKITNEI